ncbi:MAG: HAD family hydrolase [Mariprofundus sp.]
MPKYITDALKTMETDGMIIENDLQLLILDLDETLIHGSEEELDQPADFQVGQFLVYERPYLREFMNFCREHFIVAVWTTATPNYAEAILHKVCGHDYPFEFIWCRERCTARGEGNDGEFRWIKDLKKVQKNGWNLNRMLVVEDKPENLARQYGNVIRITPYSGDRDDQELKRLMPFLLELKGIENIRKIEKRGWKHSFKIGEALN